MSKPVFMPLSSRHVDNHCKKVDIFILNEWVMKTENDILIGLTKLIISFITLLT